MKSSVPDSALTLSKCLFGNHSKKKKKSNFKDFFFFAFYLFFGLAAHWILVSQPGIEPWAPAVKMLSPNHWPAREFPTLSSYNFQIKYIYVRKCWILKCCCKINSPIIQAFQVIMWDILEGEVYRRVYVFLEESDM